MPRVFVSYVRETSDQVDRLCADLRAAGIDVWLDKDDIRPGADRRDAIRDAIREGEQAVVALHAERDAPGWRWAPTILGWIGTPAAREAASAHGIVRE